MEMEKKIIIVTIQELIERDSKDKEFLEDLMMELQERM